MELLLKTSKRAVHSPKILLVEDDPHWQTLVTSMLRSLHTGAEVEVVASRAAADRALLAKETYDLILADVLLEGDGTGVDLWRAHRRDSATPIVLLSGLRTADFLEMFDPAETAPAFLSKSAGLQSLRELLTDVRARKEGPRPHHWLMLAGGVALVAAAVVTEGNLIAHPASVAPPSTATAKIERPVMSLVPSAKLGPVPTSSITAKYLTPELKERLERLQKATNEGQRQILAKLAANGVR